MLYYDLGQLLLELEYRADKDAEVAQDQDFAHTIREEVKTHHQAIVCGLLHTFRLDWSLCEDNPVNSDGEACYPPT